MRFRLVAPVLVAGALALTACGGGDSGSESTTPVDADVVVRAVDPLAWDAATYTATAGEVTIAVRNDSSQPHNLHVLDAGNTEMGVALDIPSRGDVETATVTLAAGDYTFICTIPGHTNMKSTLTVT
jgi:plastocyanin